MRVVVFALAFSVAAAPVAAQTIIETPTSVIEIVGLKRWTMAMINDSLAKYAPRDSITGHACAAVLRDKLHFADASVGVLRGFRRDDPRDYVSITVVEPQDSTLIRYKPSFKDSLPIRAEWAPAIAVIKASPQLAQRALFSKTLFADQWSRDDSTKLLEAAPLRRVILASRGAKNLADAIRTLETDGSIANRTMATIILGNFADRDSAWWALADAQRDPIGFIGSFASQMLGVLSERSPRAVNWAPVVDRLRYIVDGTNLFAFGATLNALVATRVDPSLAPELLRGGGAIVGAKLQANEYFAKRDAAAFVSHLSRLPADDIPALARWMDALDRPSP